MGRGQNSQKFLLVVHEWAHNPSIPLGQSGCTYIGYCCSISHRLIHGLRKYFYHMGNPKKFESYFCDCYFQVQKYTFLKWYFKKIIKTYFFKKLEGYFFFY